MARAGMLVPAYRADVMRTGGTGSGSAATATGSAAASLPANGYRIWLCGDRFHAGHFRGSYRRRARLF